MAIIPKLLKQSYNCGLLATISHDFTYLNRPARKSISLPQCMGRSSSIIYDESNIFYNKLTNGKAKYKERKLLGLNTKSLIKQGSRSFFGFFKKDDNPNQKKRVPKLILVQNPLKWIMIKIDFSVLKNIWDPQFEVNEFKYGTKQAISRVTQVVSHGQYTDLNGLLTKAARLSLMRELDRNWSDRQRSLLSLQQDDIQITAPRRVYFIRIAEKKFCDVDMAFLALKWAPINNIEALIFTEIFARFHREYTPHSIPEWTIAYFKVTRFQVLNR